MMGRRIQDLMLGLDPRVRFIVEHDIVRTAGDLARAGRIGGCEDAPIYGTFIDLQGKVVIGIAQDPSSPVDPDDWHRDQCEFPVLRSIDATDILGNVIRDLTEGGDR